MDANELPEKVFISPRTFIGPWPPYIDENSKYGGIEYIRTDAFIEKATEWLTKHAHKYYFNKERYLGTEELVEDFKIAMKL